MTKQHQDAKKWEYIMKSGKQEDNHARDPLYALRGAVFYTALALCALGYLFAAGLIAVFIIKSVW